MVDVYIYMSDSRVDCECYGLNCSEHVSAHIQGLGNRGCGVRNHISLVHTHMYAVSWCLATFVREEESKTFLLRWHSYTLVCSFHLMENTTTVHKQRPS